MPGLDYGIGIELANNKQAVDALQALSTKARPQTGESYVTVVYYNGQFVLSNPYHALLGEHERQAILPDRISAAEIGLGTGELVRLDPAATTSAGAGHVQDPPEAALDAVQNYYTRVKTEDFRAICDLEANDEAANTAHFFKLKKISEQVMSDWLRMAAAIGFGDAAWSISEWIMAAGSAGSAASTAMAVMFPFILGPLVAITNYHVQVENYKAKYGVEPNEEQRKIFMRDSIALCFKMAAAVGGWTAADIAASAVLKAAGVAANSTGIGTAAFWTTAVFVGVGAALGVMLFAYASECYFNKVDGKGWKLNDTSSKWQILRLGGAAFIAGFSWFVVNTLPFTLGIMSPIKGAMGEAAANLVVGTAAAGITGVSVMSAFGFTFYGRDDAKKTWNDPQLQGRGAGIAARTAGRVLGQLVPNKDMQGPTNVLATAKGAEITAPPRVNAVDLDNMSSIVPAKSVVCVK